MLTLLMVIVVGLILGLAHGMGFIDTNADLLFKQ